MSDSPRIPVGGIAWTDITVPEAGSLCEFYSAVVGWKAAPVDMGGYPDFVMSRPGGESVSGICHARGVNAKLPAEWLIYVVVADLDASVKACKARGGALVDGPRRAGPDSRMCVLRDPVGAHLALVGYDETR
jgi:predicted enzyme related to lactoylglutathione lyase